MQFDWHSTAVEDRLQILIAASNAIAHSAVVAYASCNTHSASCTVSSDVDNAR